MDKHALIRIGLALSLCLPAVGALAADWKLEKDSDGVKVYLSETPGSSYKAYRGVVDINASLDTVASIQADVATSCSWVYECKQIRVLEQKGNELWSYTQISMPWPVSARDLVIHITQEKQADGSVLRRLQGEPGKIPPSKGFVRVSRLDGYWKFEPLADNKVRVTYEVSTEPGGSVPAWVANQFVVKSPLNTLSALRDKAEKAAKP